MTTHSCWLSLLLLCLFLLLTNTARTHKAFARADQYGCMRCWVRTGSAVEARAAEREDSLIEIREEWPCLWWLACAGILIGINSHPHIQCMCYILFTQHPILHTDMYRFKCCPQSSNFPFEGPCWKITGIRVSWGLPASHSPTTAAQSPQSFPTVINKPYETLFQGSLRLELWEGVLMSFLSLFRCINLPWSPRAPHQSVQMRLLVPRQALFTGAENL